MNDGLGAREAEHGSIVEALLERDAEVEVLASALLAARGGNGRLVAVEGPPGIGKSRLLEEACGLAAEGGLSALVARASPLERGHPFGIARQLLAGTVASAPAPERQRLLGGAAALAERVLADDIASAHTQPTGDEGFAALHGLFWVLSNIADEYGALVLAIDDLQWADEASLRFLNFLAPRLPELPVCMVMAVRTGSGGADLLEALLGSAAETTLRPEPLTAAGTERLLRSWLGTPPEPTLSAVAHESVAGNPFLLRLLSLELAQIGDDSAREQAVERVRSLGPHAVRRTVNLWLSRLGDHASAVAEALAISGAQVDIRAVSALADLDPAETAAATDELEAAGLLDEDLAFVHPIVANAIYEDIGPRRRSGMHRKAAKVLERCGAPVDDQAAQLLVCDPAGDPEALATLRRAAEVAHDRGAPQTAAAYLERALAEQPPEGDRPRILFELGSAQARAGDGDATRTLTAALSTAGSERLSVMAGLELGQVLAYAGRIDEASIAMRDLLAEIGDPDLRRAVEMLQLVLAQTDLAGREGTAELRDGIDAVVAKLGRRAPRGLRSLSAFEVAVSQGPAHRVIEIGAELAGDPSILTEQGPDSPHPIGLGMALSLAGHHDGAERQLAMFIDAAARRGSRRTFAFGSAVRAWTRARRGDLTGSEADAAECLALSTSEPAWRLFEPMALSALLEVRLARDGAEAAAVELAAIDYEASSTCVFHQPLMHSAGVVLAAIGEPAASLEHLEGCRRWEQAWGGHAGSLTAWRATAAGVRAGLGDGETAAALALAEVDLARAFGEPTRHASALTAAAEITADPDRQIELLEEAVALDSQLTPVAAARSLMGLGSALRKNHRRRDSREPLRRALELAASNGNTELARRAHAELSATGERPHRTATGDEPELTPRELQVAREAAAGRSNPQIAQALFVTTKTVESHLRSIFRKLSISSRDEIAGVLSRAATDRG